MRFTVVEKIDTDSDAVKNNVYTNWYGTFTDIKDVFSSRTGVPYYDNMLADPDRTYKKYNRKASIEMMTPTEYFSACAKCFGTSESSLIKQREYNGEQNGIIKMCIDKHLKMGMPYVCLDGSRSQEGLHRMYVLGELYGWDEKYPVCVIRVADKNREKILKNEEVKRELEGKVKRAVSKTLEYKLKNWDDFESQLEWCMEREFGYNCKYSVHMDSNKEQVFVCVGEYTIEFELAEDEFPFLYKDISDTFDYDIDDINISDEELDNIDWNNYDDIMSLLNR